MIKQQIILPVFVGLDGVKECGVAALDGGDSVEDNDLMK